MQSTLGSRLAVAGCGVAMAGALLIAPTAAFGAGTGYTPAGSPTPGGTATGLAGTVASTTTVQPGGGVATGTVGSATVTATVPAGAFTGAVQVVITDATSSAVVPPGGGTAIVTFGIGIYSDGVKVTGSFPAVSITVTSPSITAGSTVYLVTGSGLQSVSGDAVKAGSATFSITSDPTIEVATTTAATTTGGATAIAGATSSQTGKPFILEGGIAALLCAVGALLLVAVRRRGRPA
jgi:hypothetical protein